ncbi:unnamed protein product [Lota lota]
MRGARSVCNGEMLHWRRTGFTLPFRTQTCLCVHLALFPADVRTSAGFDPNTTEFPVSRVSIWTEIGRGAPVTCDDLVHCLKSRATARNKPLVALTQFTFDIHQSRARAPHSSRGCGHDTLLKAAERRGESEPCSATPTRR